MGRVVWNIAYILPPSADSILTQADGDGKGYLFIRPHVVASLPDGETAFTICPIPLFMRSWMSSTVRREFA